MTAQLGILALLIAGYTLIAARLERWSLSPALAFVVIGMVVSDAVAGLIHLEPGAEPLRVLAELTLTLLLFADASTVRARALQRDALPVARLLSIGLLLTIGLGTMLAVVLYPGLPAGVALLIGAALAPTDAALGQPVVTDRVVPARIRRILNVESGLNDGIATPFVLLAVSLTASEVHGGGAWITDALVEVAVGIAVGAALGLFGGRALALADARRTASPVSRQLFVLMLALACYLVAVSLGGNGFIAAFVGGLAFGAGRGPREADVVEFTEAQGSLLGIGVWTAFGLAIAGRMLSELWDPRAVVYAVLSLTAIRMLPVAIALAGQRFGRPTILFIGWFGPRGLASLVFLAIGLEALATDTTAQLPLAATIAWTVLLSVVLHGLTARPLAARYGRWSASLGTDAPERDDGTEPTPRRTWLAQPRPTVGAIVAAEAGRELDRPPPPVSPPPPPASNALDEG